MSCWTLFRVRLEASPRDLYIFVAHGRFAGNLKDVRNCCQNSANGTFMSPRTFISSRRKVYQIGSLPLREDEALQTAKSASLAYRSVRSNVDLPIDCSREAILTPDPLISQYPARVIW